MEASKVGLQYHVYLSHTNSIENRANIPPPAFLYNFPLPLCQQTQKSVDQRVYSMSKRLQAVIDSHAERGQLR